jgi:hypothetical protein
MSTVDMSLNAVGGDGDDDDDDGGGGGNMSLNAVGGDGGDEFYSLSDSDIGKIENKETTEGQSDILCGDSDQIKEMKMEKSKKE